MYPRTLLLAPLGLLVFFLLRFIALAAYPMDINQPEGAVVFQSLFLVRNQPLYTNWHEFPYNITPYPPLYYSLVGLVAKIADASPIQTYTLARTTTFIFSCLTSIGLYFLSRYCGANRLGAFISSATFINLPLLIPWGFAARPDLPALALSVFSLLILLRKKRNHILYSCLIASAALFTKQTSISIPLITVGYFLYKRNIKVGINYLILYLSTSAALFAAFNLVTRGEFIHNLLTANITPTLSLGFISSLPIYLLMNLIIIIPAFASLLRHPPPSIFVGYFTISCLISLAFALKPGADVNYFIEPFAAAVVLASLSLSYLTKPIPLTAMLVGLLIQTNAGNLFFRRVPPRLPHNLTGSLNQSPKPVLTNLFPLAAQLNHSDYLTDPYNLSFLEVGEKWNSSQLALKIQRREYSAIVLNFPVQSPAVWGGYPQWPASILKPIRLYYKISHVFPGGYYLYTATD